MNPIFPKSKAQINREKYAAQLEADKQAVAAHRARRKASGKTGPDFVYRPKWGSQEWAETRGDDLGASADY